MKYSLDSMTRTRRCVYFIFFLVFNFKNLSEGWVKCTLFAGNLIRIRQWMWSYLLFSHTVISCPFQSRWILKGGGWDKVSHTLGGGGQFATFCGGRGTNAGPLGPSWVSVECNWSCVTQPGTNRPNIMSWTITTLLTLAKKELPMVPMVYNKI